MRLVSTHYDHLISGIFGISCVTYAQIDTQSFQMNTFFSKIDQTLLNGTDANSIAKRAIFPARPQNTRRVQFFEHSFSSASFNTIHFCVVQAFAGDLFQTAWQNKKKATTEPKEKINFQSKKHFHFHFSTFSQRTFTFHIDNAKSERNIRSSAMSISSPTKTK